MKLLNKILCFVFMLVTMILMFYFSDFKILISLLGFIVLYFININSYFKFIILIYGFLGFTLGFGIHLYKITFWYDTFIHFISGIFMGIISLYLLNKIKMWNKKNMFFNVIYVLLFVVAVSGLWEICEFFSDTIFNSDMQRQATGVYDTMKDMISALLGGIIFCSCFYFEYKNSYKLLISSFIDNMNGGSYGR